MDNSTMKKAELKLRILEAVDPLVSKPVVYQYQKEIEALAEIEDKAERERKIKALIKEINKYKQAEGKEDE